MNLSKVIFIGNARGFASGQIRCVDIATRLGCDYTLGGFSVPELTERYTVFVCVKSALGRDDRTLIARKGMVVWDVIDALPPRENVAVYLVSTTTARERFARFGRVEVIPHHHCNFDNPPNPPTLRRPVWLGARHWLPPLPGVEFDAYYVEELTQEKIIEIFRQTGIGLNLRLARAPTYRNRVAPRLALKPEIVKRIEKGILDFHLAVNSGIKLINNIGFGTPSVSSDEPAYREIGPECTIFSSPNNCAEAVRALQNDNDLYNELRGNCLRRAPEFHVDAIVRKYEALLRSL